MKIAITGATGFIGSHLTEELVRRGHAVSCLVRPTSDLRWIRRLPVTLVTGSLDSKENLRSLVCGAEAVIHTAGCKFAASERGFERCNEALTSTLLDAIESDAPGIERFVFISSMAVTGPSPDGRPLGEAEPPNPITFYGESKLRTESIVKARSPRIPYTILRPPGVYGPRDRDILPVFQMARRRVQLVIGRRNLVDLIYVKNLVHGVCLTLETPAAANGVYNIADAEAYTWEEFTHLIHHALGRRAMTVKVPGPLLTAAGWVGQRAARWTGGQMKLNDQKVRELKAPYWRLSTDLVREQLGYRPRYSVEQAINETLQWYRQEGWL